MKSARIILLNEAEESYKKLNKVIGIQLRQTRKTSFEMQLMRSIKQKIELIKSNSFYGDNIPKRLIPKEYKVQNLWRVELTGFWRMLYTIRGDEINIVCFVLDIFDHKKYNKKFGYKK